MDDNLVAKLRPGRRVEDNRLRSLNRAREKRQSETRPLTKVEKERKKNNSIARIALKNSFATPDVRNAEGRIIIPKFVVALRDKRDRLINIIGEKVRARILPETVYENGLRHLLWLRAHGHDPKYPRPENANPKSSSFYEAMVEIEVSRVKAAYIHKPDVFDKEEQELINFYLFMLKDKAIQPDPRAVNYFLHRLRESDKLKMYSAGMRTIESSSIPALVFDSDVRKKREKDEKCIAAEYFGMDLYARYKSQFGKPTNLNFIN
jgi:hypothetical protein